MVIDKTSQCGAERWAVTGGGRCWGRVGEDSGALHLMNCSASAVAEGPHWRISRWRWLVKEQGGCWHTKRRWRQAEEERRMTSEPWTRLGTWVSTNACTAQKCLWMLAPWSRCLGCFYHSVCLHASMWLSNCAAWMTPSQGGFCMGRLGTQTLPLRNTPGYSI